MRALILLPLTLAACGEAPTDTAGPAAAPAAFSAVQQRVIDLSAEQRHGVFLRAIRDGDAPCQGVVEDVRQDDQAGNPFWVVRCNDDNAYAIAIDRNGVAQVKRLSSERR